MEACARLRRMELDPELFGAVQLLEFATVKGVSDMHEKKERPARG